jgi:hypothetical protein
MMITFALIITILYPNNDLLIITAGETLSKTECEHAIVLAWTQIPQMLTDAEMINAECVEERGA